MDFASHCSEQLAQLLRSAQSPSIGQSHQWLPMSVAPAVPAEDLPKRPSPSGTADSLQGAVHAALAASAYHPVRLLDYEVTKGIVVLAGTVPSFYMKQIAQTIVMKIDGVNGIDNRLRVENGNHPSRLGHC